MMKWIVGLFLCVALASPAVAQNGSWRSIDEDNITMLAIAPDASQSGNIRRAQVGYFYAFTRAFGARIYGNESSADYGIVQMEFDCSTKGMYRSLSSKGYLLSQSAPVSNSADVGQWSTPFMNEPMQQLWDVACGKANHGTPIRGSYAQMIADYRARDASRKAEKERTEAANAKARVNKAREQSRSKALTALVPQTKSTSIQASSHWHYASANSISIVIFDLHGAVMTGQKVVTSGSQMFAETDEYDEGIEFDYTIERWEFDCATRGTHRTTALALYLKGEAAPEAAVSNPNQEWKVARPDSAEDKIWTNLCVGETPKTGLPRDQSFDQLLDWYRAQL